MGRLSAIGELPFCAKLVYAVPLLIGLSLFKADATILVITNTEDSGPGSLRQAILSANALPGTDEVHFNIPGPAPYFIRLLTELPAVTDPIIIDATTQPGYAGVPLVALDGDQATFVQSGAIAGFRLVAGNSTVRGLYIYSFGSIVFWGVGISLVGAGNNVIEGNYIGLHPYGYQFAGSTVAIQCSGSSNNRIGGPQPSSRNIISYNFFGLIVTNGPLSISSNNLVQGNFIGTDAAGSSANPNITDGILVSGGQRNLITGNRIAFNDWNGIRLISTNNGTTISENLIYGNRGLGINLQPAGEADTTVTANDDGDSDNGPNALQNFPVITNVKALNGTTVISGYLPSSPRRQFRLEFYRSSAVDPTGFGEGEIYLGSALGTSDASGYALFTFTASGLFPNQYFTATATDTETGDTGEFSEAVQARPGTLSFERANSTAGENAGSAALTVLRTDGSYGQVSVDFSTTAGSATPGADFTPATGTIVFNDGQHSQTVLVTVLDDGIDEEDEDLTVNLSGAGGGALLGTNGSATLLIVDDDPPPQIILDNVIVTTAPGGELLATFRLSLSATSSRPVTVSYATSDGTAQAGADYEAVQDSLIFQPGEVVKSVQVPITNDAPGVAEKNFFLNLTAAVNATLAQSQAQCIIRELRLFIAINGSDVEVRFHTGTSQNYTVERNSDLSQNAGWLPLSGAESIAGTGNLLTFRDALEPGAASRYYRVRLLP